MDRSQVMKLDVVDVFTKPIIIIVWWLFIYK